MPSGFEFTLERDWLMILHQMFPFLSKLSDAIFCDERHPFFDIHIGYVDWQFGLFVPSFVGV